MAGCGTGGGHTPGRAACSWHLQRPGPKVNEDLYGVSFPDIAHGWVVGGIGGPVIRATSNGGATWRAQRSPGHGLSGVSFVDAKHGWAVGIHNTLIVTADGGVRWHALNARVLHDGNLYGVSFVDARHGWIVGDKGLIEATADGGRSWRPQAAKTSVTLDKVTFSDRLHGWILTQDARVLRTVDGGASWSSTYTANAKNNEVVADIFALDPQHVWVAGSEDQGESNYGAASQTLDGGRSWKRYVAKNFDDERFGPIAFTDRMHGWVASPLNGNLWYTDDGGKSWGSRPSPTNAEMIQGMVFRDATHGWAVGASDTIMACSA